jgi:hypothetical protein
MWEEFSGREGRVRLVLRLVLAVATGAAFLLFIAAVILVEGHLQSRAVHGLVLAGQVLGFAFAASLRPHPAKWWLASAFGFGVLSSLVRLL